MISSISASNPVKNPQPLKPAVETPAAPQDEIGVSHQLPDTGDVRHVGTAPGTATTSRHEVVANTTGPQAGIRCGSYLRPDPFFSDKTQMVVHTARTGNNPTGIAEVPYGKYRMIETDQLLSGKNDVLIGFAMPKVFTIVPGAAGYEKFDAFPYFKKTARVNSADAVQSGVFIRPRN